MDDDRPNESEHRDRIASLLLTTEKPTLKQRQSAGSSVNKPARQAGDEGGDSSGVELAT